MEKGEKEEKQNKVKIIKLLKFVFRPVMFMLKILLKPLKRPLNFLKLKIVKLLNDNKIIFPFNLILWLFVDLYRFFRDIKTRKLHIYGITGYFGLYGQGKTICMTKELHEYRQKYKDRIYIFTNYGFAEEDAPFKDWKMLLADYDKPVIIAWDEVQNEFNSRDFKSFPPELLTKLTQNRKGYGMKIIYTAQRFERVDKVFRELSTVCYNCKTHLGRFTSFRAYDWEAYQELMSLNKIGQKARIKSKKTTIFIQTDKIRNLYNSYQMLQTAKTKDYMTREELVKLYPELYGVVTVN